MRIIKLSNQDPSFKTLEDVRQFFFDEMKHRTPPGKFKVTANKIRHDQFFSGELLVFTYQARVVFTAKSASELLLK